MRGLGTTWGKRQERCRGLSMRHRYAGLRCYDLTLQAMGPLMLGGRHWPDNLYRNNISPLLAPWMWRGLPHPVEASLHSLGLGVRCLPKGRFSIFPLSHSYFLPSLCPPLGGTGSVWLQAAGFGLLPASPWWPSLLFNCCVLSSTPGVLLV